MNVQELRQRIRLGEDSTLELKRMAVSAVGKVTEARADGLSDELAAMANAAGGTLVLGVDNGSIHPVIVADVPRGLWVHQSANGYFRRVDHAKRALPPDDLARLVQPRSSARIIHPQYAANILCEAEARAVLDRDRRLIAAAIHAQIMKHFLGRATGFEVKVSRGFMQRKAEIGRNYGDPSWVLPL